MIDYSLNLDYRLNTGWLTPFIEGLKQGKIAARQCSVCSRISVPPVRSCLCGNGYGHWTILHGTARILNRTRGSDGDFALVRFDGADTQTVVSLECLPIDATTGVIKQTDDNLPTLILVANETEETGEDGKTP